MSLRSRAGWSFAAALLVVACGRVELDQDGGDSNGGSGGNVGAGGQTSTGGSLSSGGSGAFGAGGKVVGLGGVSTGGFMGKGGAPNTGGKGGALGKGGGFNTGGSPPVVGGAGGFGGAPAGFVPLGDSSWDTTLMLEVTKSTNTTTTCRSASFTLHFEPSGNLLAVISGRNGSVFPGHLAPFINVANGYGLSGSLSFPSIGDCAFSSVLVSELSLQAWDDDGDGWADIIYGSGKATGTLIQGDVGMTVELNFRLSGVPDVTLPTLIARPELHPLDGVLLFASEPVSLTSAVTIVNEVGQEIGLTGNTPSDGALGNFSSPVVLPFGSRWSVMPTGQDLGGWRFARTPVTTFGMLADPGLLAQDGFESTLKGLLSGAAKVVTSVGNLPAIAGAQSLLVPPSSAATLHLARPSAANNLRFTAQMLTSVSGFSPGVPPVEVGVVGGSQRLRPTAQPTGLPPSATGDTAWSYAGPKQEFTVPISESGAELVVRIAPAACGGFCPPAQAVLIDDLRVE